VTWEDPGGNTATRAPGHAYKQSLQLEVNGLDVKIAVLKRLAAQKIAGSSSRAALLLVFIKVIFLHAWGQGHRVGASTWRPHWH
jgi:hypothetical protein